MFLLGFFLFIPSPAPVAGSGHAAIIPSDTQTPPPMPPFISTDSLSGPSLMKKMGELIPNLKSRRDRIAKEKKDKEASARAEKEKAAAAIAAASQANVKKKGKKKGKR